MQLNVIHNILRRERFQTLLDERDTQGLDLVLWPAIMDAQRPFVGICRAHKQIVRWAKQTGLREVCIGEDDLKFLAPGAWWYFLDQKPKDFDIYLGGVFHGHIAPDNSITDWCGMTLYIVRERFYDTFLNLNEANNLDRELANKGRYLVCDRMVCSQHPGYSDHKAQYVDDYDHYLEGRNLYSI